MHRALRAALVRCAGLLLLLTVGACVWITQRVDVRPVDRFTDSLEVSSAVKAHFLDGTTIVYPNGLLLYGDSLRGQGTRYALDGGGTRAPSAVPLDSVVAMESFSTSVDMVTSAVMTVGATAVAAAVGTALIVAAFGSCPTIYSDSAGTAVLEAEAFSYSIAPLFERRDVDRLSVLPDANGSVRLEIRNEAIETHYINHLELLDVTHGRDELVAPDGSYGIVALSRFIPVAGVRDRSGRDLAHLAGNGSGAVFATVPERLASATIDDFEDWIDIVLEAPPDDSVALALHLRNSLLNTVLLYDGILAPAGARALDWVSRDLAAIGPAVELGRWYASRMGMRISVWDGGAYRRVAAIPDAGPIAWRRVTALLPVPPGDSLRIRLSFVADQWRIRELAVAGKARRIEPRALPVSELRRADGAPDTAALAAVMAADGRYLRTEPSERVSVWFTTPPVPSDSARTLLLAAQGYYIEWLRGEWIRTAREPAPFRAGDAALIATMRRWYDVQDEFERSFHDTRIPVR